MAKTSLEEFRELWPKVRKLMDSSESHIRFLAANPDEATREAFREVMSNLRNLQASLTKARRKMPRVMRKALRPKRPR